MRQPSLTTALVLAGLAAPGAVDTPARASEAAVLTVAVVRPVERRWPETVPASGWVKPWHEAVVAAEIGGLRVTEVLVDVGAVVVRGQILARLADDTVRADLRKEEAALATATADLTKAQANAERARKLQGSGALSAEKIADYLFAEEAARAAVRSAEALVEGQTVRLAQTAIRAVDDGVISARSVQLGMVVGSGGKLFRLVRQRRVEWQAEVAARDVAYVRAGMGATIIGPGERRLAGTVRLVAPTINADTGRGLVFVALPDGPPPIGLHVAGRIELATTPALTVPETALVPRDGFAYVFTVDADRRVRRTRVTTGRREGGEVEIVAGLAGAVDLVRAGGAFLSDGALVRLEDTGR